MIFFPIMTTQINELGGKISQILLENLIYKPILSDAELNHWNHLAIVFTNNRDYIIERNDKSGDRFISQLPTKVCHAEMKALKLWLSNHLRDGKFRKINKIKIYSIRTKKMDGSFIFGLAKPCYHCSLSLKKWNIKKIFYTDENGNLNQWDLDINKTSPSAGNASLLDWYMPFKK